MDVFVVLPSLQWKFLNCASGTTVRNLVDQFTLDLGISTVDFYVKHNGRVSSGEELLHPRGVYRFEPRLPGGKGGFGSMLRALGAQIEKTTNREACRDLSGRRLRDVNHEKEMAEWLKKQAEREAGKEQRRLERLQRKLAEPRHLFSDPDYEQQCHDLSERLEDSVLKGMQAASSDMVQADAGPSRKRPVATVATTTSASAQKTNKKKCLWTGMEDLVGSDENSESDSDDGDNISPSTSSSTSCSSTGPSAAAAAKPPSSSSTSSSFLTSATGRPDQPNFQKATSGSSSSSSCSASSSPERAGSGAGAKPPLSGEPLTPQPSDKAESKVVEEESAGTGGHLQATNSTVISTTESTQAEMAVPVDLSAVGSVVELEAMGLDRLKRALIDRGMKCGGTLQERAARLFSVRGLANDQIDPALLAKATKTKKK